MNDTQKEFKTKDEVFEELEYIRDKIECLKWIELERGEKAQMGLYLIMTEMSEKIDFLLPSLENLEDTK